MVLVSGSHNFLLILLKYICLAMWIHWTNWFCNFLKIKTLSILLEGKTNFLWKLFMSTIRFFIWQFIQGESRSSQVILSSQSCYLELEKYLCSVFQCFCNIWRLYEKNMRYDMLWRSIGYLFHVIEPLFHTFNDWKNWIALSSDKEKFCLFAWFIWFIVLQLQLHFSNVLTRLYNPLFMIWTLCKHSLGKI